MFVMPADEEYNLTLPVNGDPMYLEIRTGTGNTSSRTIRYSDLTIPLTTTAMLAVSPQGIADLRYDSDGDGSFDATVPPTVSVVGDAAGDAEPPEVAVSVEREGGRWMARITATDAGSGLAQIRYSTDDRRYTLYEGPFAVDPADVTTIYAFADDNVANRSAVTAYELDLNTWWSTALRYGIVAVGLLLIAGGGLVAYQQLAVPRSRRRNIRRKPSIRRRRPNWLLPAIIAVVLILGLLALMWFFGFADHNEPAPDPVASNPGSAAAPPDPAPAGATVLPSVPAPTATQLPPTSTPLPPTSTPLPPTATLLPSTTPLPAPTTIALTAPPIAPRSAWGAVAPGAGMMQHTPARIVLSHDTRPCCDPSAPGQVRADQRVHMETSGWPDIAYHYLVAPDGTIYAGRDAAYRSNSSYIADNPEYPLDGTLLIGALGNFDSQQPSAEALRSISWLMAWLCREYNIPPDEIYHFSQLAPIDPWIGETTSPGRNMPDATVFRSNVAAILMGERAP
jgi:hypothetical protein